MRSIPLVLAVLAIGLIIGMLRNHDKPVNTPTVPPAPVVPLPDEQPAPVVRPKLMLFTAEWCQPCKEFHNITLKNETVKAKLDGYIFQPIDIDQSKQLAGYHKVTSVPTLILFDKTGLEVKRASGYMSPDQFIRWLGPP